MLLIYFDVPPADQFSWAEDPFSAVIFDAGMKNDRLKVCRSLVDDIVSAVISAPGRPFVRAHQLQRLKRKLYPFYGMAQQKLIAQMRALMIERDPVGFRAPSKSNGKTDRVVGVHQLERWSIKIKLCMDPAAKTRLPAEAAVVVDGPVQSKKLSIAAHGGVNFI